MSFTITHERDEDLDLLQITDFSTGIQVRLLPGSGAILHEFSIPLGNRRIQVINNYKNLADLEKNSSFHKSAKLSPFVCRIAGGKYTFNGKSYEFEKKFADGSAIHGILSDKPFIILDKKVRENEAAVRMEHHYKKTNPAYPFEYRIQISYTLKKGGILVLETSVKNESSDNMPLADGWHPYFNLEGSVNDWLLSLRSVKKLAFDEKLIPVGHLVDEVEFYSPRLIGERFFDNCYLLEPGLHEPAATLENPDNGLRLLFFPDSHYPYLQIYTPGDRQSIAIENLSAAPDCFNNSKGLIILAPGDSQSFSVSYQLEFR
jgi:aldose 1-epimerase